MATISTKALQPGMRVVTSEVVGEDFGLPLVEPTSRTVRSRVVRTVRASHNRRVYFEDGVKTDRIHGRTAWTLAEQGE